MKLKLLLHTDEDSKICHDCGYGIPDPYFFDIWYFDYRTARKRKKMVLCSTCDAQWGHQKWINEQKEKLHNPESLGPPRCECDRLLPDCEVAICHRFPDYKPSVSVIPYRSKSGALLFKVPKQPKLPKVTPKPKPPQLDLWR